MGKTTRSLRIYRKSYRELTGRWITLLANHRAVAKKANDHGGQDSGEPEYGTVDTKGAQIFRARVLDWAMRFFSHYFLRILCSPKTGKCLAKSNTQELHNPKPGALRILDSLKSIGQQNLIVTILSVTPLIRLDSRNRKNKKSVLVNLVRQHAFRT